MSTVTRHTTFPQIAPSRCVIQIQVAADSLTVPESSGFGGDRRCFDCLRSQPFWILGIAAAFLAYPNRGKILCRLLRLNVTTNRNGGER